MSREVCGICWCPYDDDTGACGCKPVAPPEAQTQAEKIAYCAGWWDALAKARGSEERNFCPRCGKRTNDIHTCTPPHEERFCDTHCTWADHAPGCVRAEPVQEPVAWMYEDTLPKEYPYDAMWPHSAVRDGVRMFPVFAPPQRPAEPDTDCHAQGICQRSGYGIN